MFESIKITINMKTMHLKVGLILATCFIMDASAAGACMKRKPGAAPISKDIALNNGLPAKNALSVPALLPASAVVANASDIKTEDKVSTDHSGKESRSQNSSGATATDEIEKVVDAPALSKEIKWTLVGGKSIRTQLFQWAEISGWHIDWKINVDWMVPSSITYTGTFDHALETVIEQLYAQGKPVRLMIWSGNQVAEVVGNDVK